MRLNFSVVKLLLYPTIPVKMQTEPYDLFVKFTATANLSGKQMFCKDILLTKQVALVKPNRKSN